MNELIILDRLDENSVSVKKQNYTTINGIQYPIGKPWRRAYVNSANGRAQIAQELGEPYLTAVMSVWGDAPTVEQ